MNSNQMISDERLEQISQCSDVATLFAYEQRQMARELLALRKPQPVSQHYKLDEELYRLATHIASSKEGLPEEWEGWISEIESDLRRYSGKLQSSDSDVVIEVDPASGKDRTVITHFSVPPGFKLMPIEPTEEIKSAITRGIRFELFAEGIYADVLATAPGTLTNEGTIDRGWLLIPAKPSQAHLISIAKRYRHDFPFLDSNQKEGALAVARQMYEECSGQGFFTIPASEMHNAE